MKTKPPCCVVNGVCRHKTFLFTLTPHTGEYRVPHPLTQCAFRFCDEHWAPKLQVLDRATKAWQQVVAARPPIPWRWAYNRLHGDGSTWVPRWGTKYAAELIQLHDCVEGTRRKGAPRKGRMFSRDGTTATNLRKGGYLEKVKGGFILTEKGRKYIKTQGDM